jgi:hypothetical protein
VRWRPGARNQRVAGGERLQVDERGGIVLDEFLRQLRYWTDPVVFKFSRLRVAKLHRTMQAKSYYG